MRLVLAARKSAKVRDGDGQRDGITLDTQDRRGREWAERHGHVIVGVAADTKSGTVAPWDRPNLRPWVTDPARMATYDGILAYRNDRLSRGCWDDEARIRMWARDHGKILVIVDGPQWPPRDDGDSWAWEAMAKAARKEWEEIRERTMRAQAELRERGKLVGRWPFGYASEGDKYDRRLVPTSEGRLWVPFIFERVINGDSLATIARWLDAAGVTPTQGGKWWPGTIAAMVRNPVYVGQRQDADGRTIHRCEPLLVTPDGTPDFATFRLAGEALAARPKRGPVKPDTRAMLGGVLTCGNPGCTAGPDSPMYRITAGSRTQVRVPYYRCCGRGSQRKGCGTMVRCDVADAAVSEVVARSFNVPVMVRTLVPGHDHTADIEAAEWELRQLPAQGLTEDAEDARRAELRAERKRLQALPAVPDTWAETPTADTYAALYNALPANERGPWLKARGFTVTASRARVTVTQGRVSITVDL